METSKQQPTRSGRLVVWGVIAVSIITVASVLVFRKAGGVDPLTAFVPAQPGISFTFNLPEQGRWTKEGFLGAPGNAGYLAPITADLVRNGDYEGVPEYLGREVAWFNRVLIARQPDRAAAVHAVEDVTSNKARANKEILFLGSDDSNLHFFASELARGSLARNTAFRDARERVGGDGLVLVRVAKQDQVPLLARLYEGESDLSLTLTMEHADDSTDISQQAQGERLLQEMVEELESLDLVNTADIFKDMRWESATESAVHFVLSPQEA